MCNKLDPRGGTLTDVLAQSSLTTCEAVVGLHLDT